MLCAKKRLLTFLIHCFHSLLWALLHNTKLIIIAILFQVWSCEGCYAIFHIQCIQKWVKDGVYQQVYKSDDNIKHEDIPWHWYILNLFKVSLFCRKKSIFISTKCIVGVACMQKHKCWPSLKHFMNIFVEMLYSNKTQMRWGAVWTTHLTYFCFKFFPLFDFPVWTITSVKTGFEISYF